MRNRVRRVSTDGRPGVAGLVAIGDAAATSNPAHTRGTSLALAHARSLARQVDLDLDPADLSTAMADVLDAELVPWVHDSAAQDAARLSRWRSDWRRDDVFADLAPETRLTNGEASVAAQADRDVWSRFTRLQNCLTLPMATLDDDAFVARVRAVQATGWRPEPVSAPSHDEMAELAATHRRGRERAVAIGT
jgi:flavin-dependent dehydrogenase